MLKLFGFMLIELMIIVVILGLLFLLVFFVYNNYFKCLKFIEVVFVSNGV